MRLSLASLAFAGLLLSGALARAAEEDEIVSGCYGSNAEWGTEAMHRCVEENLALRAEILKYPAQHARIVNRCRRIAPAGWAYVKSCIEQDIAADAALAAYPQTAQLAACQADHGQRGAAAVKACVDDPSQRAKPRDGGQEASEAPEVNPEVRHQ